METKKWPEMAEIETKYADIEDKIPSIWPDYEQAGIELAQDICMSWNIQDAELIRVISLVQMRVPRLNIIQHIDPVWSFRGLYPEKIRKFNIKPE